MLALLLQRATNVKQKVLSSYPILVKAIIAYFSELSGATEGNWRTWLQPLICICEWLQGGLSQLKRQLSFILIDHIALVIVGTSEQRVIHLFFSLANAINVHGFHC
jgi:hypothetical protein